MSDQLKQELAIVDGEIRKLERSLRNYPNMTLSEVRDLKLKAEKFSKRKIAIKGQITKHENGKQKK